MDYDITYNEKIKKLTVRGAKVFPAEILAYAKDVEILDMSYGDMDELPHQISQFRNMRVLFLSNHKFTHIPLTLAGCSKLEMLGMKSCQIREWAPDALPSGIRAITLTDNVLASIPLQIGILHANLEKLMLTGNNLIDIPQSLASTSIELLRVADNNLQEFPDVVRNSASLKWFTDSGNAYSRKAENLSPEQIVDINELVLGKEVGRSAKNTVYASYWNGECVAVKLFGPGVTTDGMPASEVSASIGVGGIKGIAGANAVVTNADQVVGMVMPLIGSNFQSIAQPPDLLRYTRDVQGVGLLDVGFVSHCLYEVGTALLAMHERGVAHGDVYGHNILANKRGESVIVDMGAASRFHADDTTAARLAIESRAFLLFCEELIERCIDADSSALSQIKILSCEESAIRQVVRMLAP